MWLCPCCAVLIAPGLEGVLSAMVCSVLRCTSASTKADSSGTTQDQQSSIDSSTQATRMNGLS